jgi:type II secretion system protein G
MRRFAAALLLLAGCAAPPPPPQEPITAEQTYFKIREVLLQSPAVQLKLWTYNFWTRDEREPLDVFMASGNRIRIARKGASPTVEFICNGTQAVSSYQWHQEAPELTVSLKNDLLRGQFWSSRMAWASIQTSEGYSVHRYFSEYFGLRHFKFGPEGASGASLTFEIYMPGHPAYPAYPVTIYFAPRTFALRRVESQYPATFEITSGLRAEFQADPAIPDSLFALPEDPAMRIDQTKLHLREIREALDRYLIDTHVYPTTEQGLDALIREPQNPRPPNWKGPYLDEELPVVDGWGRPYSYLSPRPGINPQGYDLWSWGYDGESGTSDDLRR